MEDTNRNKTVTGEVETEMHFLLRCKLLSDVRTTYFNQFRSRVVLYSCLLNWVEIK